MIISFLKKKIVSSGPMFGFDFSMGLPDRDFFDMVQEPTFVLPRVPSRRASGTATQKVQSPLDPIVEKAKSDNNAGVMSLMVAAQNGELETVKALVEKAGINPGVSLPLSSLQSAEGDIGLRGFFSTSDPLQRAASAGHLEVVRYFVLEKRFSPDRDDLLYCSRTDQVLNFLVTHMDRKSVDAQLHDLLRSVRYDHQERVLDALFKTGRADRNQVLSDGFTPLTFAVQSRCIDSVDLLISHRDVDVNKGDAHNKKPLDYTFGHSENLEEWEAIGLALLERGASPTPREPSAKPPKENGDCCVIF